MKNLSLIAVCFLLVAACAAQNFSATPLTDFQSTQLYLGKFPGFLYEGSNTLPVDHDTDGKRFASQVQPLDSNGRPSPNGKIVVIGVGMSNWTIELCSLSRSHCIQESFLSQAAANPQVNHTTLVLVDCAKGGQSADRWLDDTYGNYTQCQQALAMQHVTEAQVQVILYMNALEGPTQSLTPTTVCSQTSTVDACQYERDVAITARFVKKRYPSLKEMFLHSREFGGYAAPGTLNPEPFAYEYGFSTKWLIEAQIQQIRTGTIDPTAGDLSYTAAPWLAWGPYFWASGPISRQEDGLNWMIQDFVDDLTHPAPSGVGKVSGLMIPFYLSSPYSPWF